MRNTPSALLPLFRSERMARALTELYLHPDQEYSLTDLAKAIDVSPSALHPDIERLTTADLVRDRTDGRSRKLTANTDHPAFAPLAELLAVSFGPRTVIEEEFAAVAGVTELVLFGSWAARSHGEPGHFPHDVDVLIVGEPNRREVYAAADAAAARLHLEVNPTLATAERWNNSDDALMTTIRSNPYVELPVLTKTSAA
jgi:predicted nucleotidyltransferase